MDQAFLGYYEQELAHLRDLAVEFAELHPNVAGNLGVDHAPCPDPYVERLLEGVAFLGARARLKVDVESSRYTRNILDELYPNIAGPAPALSKVILHPGPQVQTMTRGHTVERRTRLVSALKDGLSTRCIYTTVQDVTLWPITLKDAIFLQDKSALAKAGVPDEFIRSATTGLQLTVAATGAEQLSILSERKSPESDAFVGLDRLDVHFPRMPMAGRLFDAIFGATAKVLARAATDDAQVHEVSSPSMIGLKDSEALLPPARQAFEGYRVLQEYFLAPDRFHYARFVGLAKAVADCSDAPLDIILLFDRDCANIADVTLADFELFSTPVVNLFEKECNVVDIDSRRTQHIVHPDRTRPQDFEIHRLLRVEDVDREGPDATIERLFSFDQNRGTGQVYSVERRPRRATDEERRQQNLRTSYAGEDVHISISTPADGGAARMAKRLDIRALCTNRDLPILDDTPVLTLESGDPVGRVELSAPIRPPRPAITIKAPQSIAEESRSDELTWRLVSQFSLNFISLAEEGADARPLQALLDLYSDRGDPKLKRHAQALVGLRSRPRVERLPISGPMCFGRCVEIALEMDETIFAGHSNYLLSALLAHVCARYSSINSYVRTKTILMRSREEVDWPILPGKRNLI
ncbi:MAG: type VI secretion system baseplate subunit TssF [Pseudomonadota bacterium]